MSLSAFRTKVLIMAGKCPAILKSGSLKDVEEWINEINKFKKPNQDYQTSVYRYWARQHLHDDPITLEEVLENISIVTNTRETVYSLSIKSS